MENTEQNLKSQLSQFGLNPKDWFLVPKSDTQIEIIHLDDPGLKLHGTTQKNLELLTWSSIHYSEN